MLKINSCPVMVYAFNEYEKEDGKHTIVKFTESGNRKATDKGHGNLYVELFDPEIVGDIKPGCLVKFEFVGITSMTYCHDRRRKDKPTLWEGHPTMTYNGGKLTVI